MFADGQRQRQAGWIAEAIRCYKGAIQLKPDFADAHNRLGSLLASQGNIDEALAHYGKALEIHPDHIGTHLNFGKLLKEQGKLEEAMGHYEHVIAVNPGDAEAHYQRADLKKFSPGDAHLAALEALASRRDVSPTDQVYVYFALAKALQDAGDYERAFDNLQKGNAIKRRQVEFNEQRSASNCQRLTTIFTSSLMAQFEGVGHPSTVPIFVLGMPRSGSTLAEQILSSHPLVQGAGEITALDAATNMVLKRGRDPVAYPECIPGLDGAQLRQIGQAYLDLLPGLEEGKTRIVDKLPGNFFAVGLIRLVLPNAKIIHTVRDPLDTCVSCYSKLFGDHIDYSYDLAELGRYYRRYSKLMTHWKSILPPDAILDVSYEAVVDDLEGQARRLIDYCGLAWDDRCMDFQGNRRRVTTASNVQIRQPLFRSSLQRWRKYESGLGPLLQELGIGEASG